MLSKLHKKQAYWGFVILACFAVGDALAAVPADTIRTSDAGISTIAFDNVNASTYWLRYHGTVYNLTEVLANITITPVSEWGLVLGTTGDWFDYTDISGATPVYIGLQVHPDNVTLGVLPQVYDKDATHWQLALYWYNGTQYNKGDVLVMYHAHIEWDNPTGDSYTEPNEEQT